MGVPLARKLLEDEKCTQDMTGVSTQDLRKPPIQKRIASYSTGDTRTPDVLFS